MEPPRRALASLSIVGLVFACLFLAYVSVVVHPAVGVAMMVGVWILAWGFGRPYLFLLLFIAILLARPAEFFPQLERIYPAKIAAVLALLTFMFFKLSRREFSLVSSKHNPWMLVLAGAALAAAVLGASAHYGLTFYREVFFKIIIIYFLLVNLVRSGRDGVALMKVAVGIAVILSIYAFYRSSMGIGLVEGTRVALEGALADPNDFALVLLFGAPFLLTLGFEKRGFGRLLPWAFLFVVVSGILLTQSRGGLLGLAVGTGWILRGRVRNKAVFAIVFGVVVVALLLLADISSRQVGGDLAGGLDESASTRLSAWGSGLRMFIHNPLLGVGLDQFTGHYLIYAVNPPVYEPYDAHNSYIKVLAETGIVGFIPFAMLLWLTLRGAWRLPSLIPVGAALNERALMMSLFPTVIAVSVASFFLSHSWNWFFYILHALVAALIALSPGEVANETH